MVLKGQMLVDISGPSLNFLIKLMAVESLVFAPFFATHGGFNLQTVFRRGFYVIGLIPVFILKLTEFFFI